MKHLKRIPFILLFAILIFASPSMAWAAEKQMQVELDKDYSSCLFKLVFENPGEYQATLTDINGNQYEFVRIDDTTMTCTLEKVKAGGYVTQITNEAVEDIGKVTLSVTTNNVSTTDIVNNNIMVGKDISGLKMYFKDDTFIAKWTDETCGAVDVKVVNLDTAETIKSEKVTDKDFDCAIADYVKRISVTIVPSSSSNITGAELSYTFDINNYPDASVTIPDFQKTNQNEILVNVVLGGTYGVYVEDNEECVLTTDLMIKGTYDIEVPLKSDGKNDIMFYIVDPEGNMRSTHFVINKDTVAPSLSLSEEYDGMEVNEQTITVSGTVANYNTFKVNDSDVQVATDGFFEQECILHWGENKICIVAADDAGNETSYDIIINAVEPEQKADWKMILVVVVAVIAMIYSILMKHKRKKDALQKSKSDGTESDEEDIEDMDDIEGFEADMFENEEHISANAKSSERKSRNHKHRHFHFPHLKRNSTEETDHENDQNEEFPDNENDRAKYEAYDYEDAEDYEDTRDYEDAEDYEDAGDYKAARDNEEIEDYEDAEDYEDIGDYEDELLDMHGVPGKQIKEETREEDDEEDGEDVDGIYADSDMDQKEKRATPTLEYPKNTHVHTEKYGISNEHKLSEVIMRKTFLQSDDSDTEQLSVKTSDQTMAKEEAGEAQNTNETEICVNSDSPENPEHSASQGHTVINIITDDKTLNRSHKKKKNRFWGDVLYFAVVAALIYCLFHFVFLNGYISSGSMEPTMMEGDYAISNRLAYAKRSPKCGDIIFFERDGELLGKRIIGIGGDTVSFSDGQVLINGQVLDEAEYIPEGVSTICDTTFEVPEGSVFVLGDNREDSFDSRYWDEPFVPISDIKAKYMFLIPSHGIVE